MPSTAVGTFFVRRLFHPVYIHDPRQLQAKLSALPVLSHPCGLPYRAFVPFKAHRTEFEYFFKAIVEIAYTVFLWHQKC